MKYKVPFIKPQFPDVNDVAADYSQILASNWFTNFGPFEQRFAKEIGAYIGEGFYAATFSSATAGLIASILTILGHGDGSKYVIMPSFTFAAGADALIWCGYKPLFLDIESSGLHMDISQANAVFESLDYKDKISGILFCNAFGVGAINIEAWEVLSKKTGAALIIDSAAGFGSAYSISRRVGSAGICEIFSFHATKPFAIGEGGAVVSRDKALIEKLYSIQNFGFNVSKVASSLGFNGKMQEINAAIGLRQFSNFEGVLKNRKSVFNMYKQALDVHRYDLQENAENASLCFATVVVKSSKDRDRRLALLKEAGIDAKTYYSPSIHKQNYFENIECFSDLDVTNRIDSSVLSLPIHDNMRDEDISLIIKTLNN